MSYHKRGRRGGSTAASRWMNLRYAGTCKVCGDPIPEGALAFWDSAARTVTCQRIDCADADGLTTEQPLTGPWDTRTDLRVRADSRIGAPAPVPPRDKVRHPDRVVMWADPDRGTAFVEMDGVGEWTPHDVLF
jgi:hypothetical protein